MAIDGFGHTDLLDKLEQEATSGTVEHRLDETLERELRLRVHHLEHEVARLERERLEYELMGRRLVGELEQDVRIALEDRLRSRHPLPEALRDGTIVPPTEVPPEAVLDIAETVYWRHALAEGAGLQTLLFLRDDDHMVPAANSASQLPVLNACLPSCRRSLEDVVRDRAADGHAHRMACPSCGGEVWLAPMCLRHAGTETVLGFLVGHALEEPAEAGRRMVSLVANLAGQRASETYAHQVDALVQMKVTSLVHRYTEDQTRVARDARIVMLEKERTSQDLARTREDLERALMQAGEARREAERANRVKSLFLAAMSHEIRTPLTCVIGFADLLTMPTLKEEEIRQFATSIKESGQVLMSLINNVLDLSKIEAGRLELEHIPFDMPRLLEEIGTLFTSAARDKGIELILDIDPELPSDQVGDPTRVRQVVMNLVGNAIKFTQDGSVVVACRRSREAPGFLTLTVTDTGMGIPEHRLPTIFDAFRQADSETTRQYGGTGLGLAISYRIVQEMGGALSVESEPDLGSTFTCHLPRRLGHDGS